jgi:histone H3/H4
MNVKKAMKENVVPKSQKKAVQLLADHLDSEVKELCAVAKMFRDRADKKILSEEDMKLAIFSRK